MVKNINTRMIMKIISLIWNFSKDLEGFRFYDPGENTKEDQIRKFLKSRWRDKYGY